ncbi:hypothetical protein MA16_Dca012326 [Dendrobium catenatum]|uniref:Uncharacterized protein n=1 Tax=Dendrobium catenatum TaxID=906689 RepID=A0A2I0WRC6_9ASPA|nr:hypothetical protein MA16_Dca012326 [Dendrobium catenatum]
MSGFRQKVGTECRALNRTSVLWQDVGSSVGRRDWTSGLKVVVWRGSAVVRRGSCGDPAVVRRGFCGGPAVVRRGSVVVRRGSVVVRRGSVVVRRWSGGCRGGAPSFSSSSLLFFSLLLRCSLVKNEGSIYRFSGVAWSVNRFPRYLLLHLSIHGLAAVNLTSHPVLERTRDDRPLALTSPIRELFHRLSQLIEPVDRLFVLLASSSCLSEVFFYCSQASPPSNYRRHLSSPIYVLLSMREKKPSVAAISFLCDPTETKGKTQEILNHQYVIY